jgi:phosphatidylserine/phosphatidylglycerophosphate/cardiolipin synthase-like enzyme
MTSITSARAWANNEVAYIAWDTDGKIAGCLGFEVTRVYLDSAGNETERAKCAAWVAFKGQRNRDWLPQDTGVWPVQKMSWRDLTLRKRRDRMRRRPDEVTVRYEIRAVGDLKPGRPPVPSNGRETALIARRDAQGAPLRDAAGKVVKIRGKAYQGPPRPLGYLGPAFATNTVTVTSRRPPFRSTFTNGILAAQWLANVLNEDGVIEANELMDKITNPADPHRKYLAGDVLPLLHELFARPGSFLLALYELEDAELEQLILDQSDRVQVILANTGPSGGAWDVRNAPARARLRSALGTRLQDRMFNNSTHIGHNKFVLHVDAAGVPQAVFSGSTNWTSTGIAGQTNNALLIEDAAVAQAFFDYWHRMHDGDALPQPLPRLSSPMGASQQGAAFRRANQAPAVVALAGGASIETWFSPNMLQRRKPASKTQPTPVPPDLQAVYRLMRQARQAILFLAFYPGQRGVDCILGEAIDIGRKDASMLVMGAVSSAQAMPNYVAGQEDEDSGEVRVEGQSPTLFRENNVEIVRAARIDEDSLLGDLGVEQLTARGGIGAIIHDKIVVIDPASDDCSVILGSHNLGFKASYSNDENLLIVRGHRELAMAYAVHVLDVYDHYRFRAIENDIAKKGKSRWSGFLSTNDRWQQPYVDGSKGALSRYFAR